MNWYLFKLPALCGAAALLELDDAHVGQCLLARPFVTGTALGTLLGSPWQGATLGAVLELVTIDDLPIGHRIPLNATIAASVSVLLALGTPGLDPALAFPAGLLAGHFFRRVENWIRLRRADDAGAVDAALSRGKRVPFGRILTKAIAWQALFVGLFLYAAVAAGGPALSWAWPLLPETARAGAGWALEAAPWLGIATALQLLRPR